MYPDPRTLVRLIQFEQDQQHRALMTESILRDGWDAPPATPHRLRRLLVAAGGLLRDGLRPVPRLVRRSAG